MSDRVFGLPKPARILTSAEFSRVMGPGRRAATEHFILFYAEAAGDRSRLGTVVSRKTGNAVRRNKIKRLLRETFRTRCPFFTRPADIVILARKQASFEHITHEVVVRELEQALIRATLLEAPLR